MNIEDMDLPLANTNEELETISRNMFKILFDTALFEIRSEDYRDKGVDFSIELKKNRKYTNFRFNIQLKASGKMAPNNDGSFSLSIQTSNIQYLLNGGYSAYYVLYIEDLNIFYIEDLNLIINHCCPDKTGL